jgi:hypothetical protein
MIPIPLNRSTLLPRDDQRSVVWFTPACRVKMYLHVLQATSLLTMMRCVAIMILSHAMPILGGMWKLGNTWQGVGIAHEAVDALFDWGVGVIVEIYGLVVVLCCGAIHVLVKLLPTWPSVLACLYSRHGQCKCVTEALNAHHNTGGDQGVDSLLYSLLDRM